MDALAGELAISRATLYRAVGSRDALLGDVFWTIGEMLIAEASGEATGTGPDRVIAVSRIFAELHGSAEQLRRFSAAEPQTAARVLLTAAGDVTGRAADAQLKIFLESGIEGDLDDLRRRAALYVRTLEGALYGPLLGSGPIDFESAEPALRALLTR
ncbi:QsdR family transcriptional regulator [Actinoplanes sp. NEAU-A12]|uniref:QsdR family transcriptional regulator n=1 Tax=Actinoplanes sandaracinus TaxID=3045177 RepID=A0ABT6WKE9_9ACTN|nr:QsdR family transcriptional regulator [Actinoplanes sandaracinus]MDI6100204.1 QsdR family transcriptional regulator [Actinoplanes sandaracinus]